MEQLNEFKEKIQHIIVLIMENRSFDHMMGHLKLETENKSRQSRVDGLETRTCDDLDHCETVAFKPFEERSCTLEEAIREEGVEAPEEVTGPVLPPKRETTIVLLSFGIPFLIVLALLGVLLYLRKRRKR